MTRDEWTKVVKVIFATWPGKLKDLSAMTLEVWYAALSSYPAITVIGAVVQASMECEWPSLNAIASRCSGAQEDPILAWGEALRGVGQMRYPLFVGGVKVENPIQWSDPLIPECIQDIGGPTAFLVDGDSALASLRHNFCRLLKAKRDRKNLALVGGVLEDVQRLAGGEPVKRVAGPVKLNVLKPGGNDVTATA